MDKSGDILQLCRLCLVKDDVNIPIFEGQGDIRQIFEKISSCLPVKVKREDKLPQKICDGCSYKLDMFYEFWNGSANAEKQLLAWLGEASTNSKLTDGIVSATTQHIKPTETVVKQETIDPSDIHAEENDDKSYMFQQRFSEEEAGPSATTNEEEPPPKRARRTAAVKAQIAMDPESDDDDDSGEPLTKIEDESEDSEGDDHEPTFVDVPSTSADDQPGPSGVGKDGAEAPTSRNKRTSERGNFNVEDVSRAIKAVMLENESVRAAAGRYNVPRSTLRRYIEKVSNKYSDLFTVSDENLQETIQQVGSYTACAVKQVFSVEQERALVSYAKKYSDHYYGLNITELRELAYQFGKKIQVKYPSKWDEDKMSGRDWYYGFMRRHQELSLRTPEQTTLHRVKSFSEENVQVFFRNLDAVLSEYPYQAADIWNMDETGFSTVPTNIGKVISTRGMRRVGQISAQERGSMITMALAVSADGNSIPPFFLFAKKNMQCTFLENASPGAIGFANESGWMQQTEFIEYIKFFVEMTKASKQSPKLLLLDNHSSHLSIEALDFSAENGVTILSFPPHCGHRLQPLDVSIYGPVKAHYKSQCSAWQKKHAGKILEIRHIPGLVRATLDLALTPRNVKAGFLASGICPYNPYIFADSDFIQAVYSEENERAVLEAEVTEGDLQGRITVLDTPRVGTNGKVASSISMHENAASATDTHEEVASSSLPSTSSSHESTLSTILSLVGPLQAAAPAVNSNRGRRAMKSTVLISPESREELREKQQKRDVSKTPQKRPISNARQSDTKTPAKGGRPPKKTQKQPSSDDNVGQDFCIICLELMPLKLNRNNSIACIECKRDVRLKCVKLSKSYFICRNCDSD